MRLLILFVVFLQFIPTGCSTVPESKPGEAKLRAEAVHLYRYQGLRGEKLLVEPPTLSSDTVSPGDKLTMELKIAVLSPQKEKQFKVLEVITLSGPDVVVELLRQESERPQELRVSTFQFLIPKDLPPGDYTLITTVVAEDQQITKRTGFRVKK